MKTVNWVLLTLLVAGLFVYARTKPLHDFTEYWAASQQLVGGRNPYSFSESLPIERAVGWSGQPLVAMYPPWTLPLIAPVGFIKSYAIAWTVWVCSLTFVLWWSTKVLLGIYAGGQRLFPAETAQSEAMLAFTFFPSLFCMAFAQIAPLVLLGITGFLYFVMRNRYVPAGACLAFVAIKPHLLYLLWPALLLWCWRKRNWWAVISLVCAVTGLLGVALIIRPSLLSDYWRYCQSGYMRDFPSAFGAVLRYTFESGSVASFPLQFVAPAVGAIWFVFYWRKHASDWDWKKHMPMLIAASVLTAAYGWTFDQVVLLAPLVAIVARYVGEKGKLPGWIVAAYTVLNLAVFVLAFRGPAAPYVLAPLCMVLVLWRPVHGEAPVKTAGQLKDIA